MRSWVLFMGEKSAPAKKKLSSRIKRRPCPQGDESEQNQANSQVNQCACQYLHGRFIEPLHKQYWTFFCVHELCQEKMVKKGSFLSYIIFLYFLILSCVLLFFVAILPICYVTFFVLMSGYPKVVHFNGAFAFAPPFPFPPKCSYFIGCYPAHER